MARFDPENLLIVGAGFSANAGLPLASNFTHQLLNLRGLNLGGPSRHQIRFLRTFVDQVFGEGNKGTAKDWPELEDIFTLIDLSANTGHHLGPNYSASELRIARRAIIVRMIRMLSQAYKRQQGAPNSDWRALEKLFAKFNFRDTAVLSMNWDTVFERGVARTQRVRNYDYGCHASAVEFSGGGLAKRSVSGDVLHILKPHGSVNWLYCDACRETFWVRPKEAEKVAQTLFRRNDWDFVLKGTRVATPTVLSPPCPHCDGSSLGTRFATFSYRKALEFPMHSASWRTAELFLRRTPDWVFIGYSMPPADFEFKHLLKRVQLTENTRPTITVITKGAGAGDTVARFKKFFGIVDGERYFFTNGIDREARKHLHARNIMLA